jgi:hypothetical protein
MKSWKVLGIFAVVVLVGGSGYVVGSQSQQHDLGLEKAIPEIGSESDPPDDQAEIPGEANVIFRVVGQQGDYVLVELMVKQGESWRPAKIQAPGSGFEYAGDE